MAYRLNLLPALGLLTLGLLTSACGLIGIEPDEIDVANETDEVAGDIDETGDTANSSTDGGSTEGTTLGDESTDDGTTGTSDTSDTSDTTDSGTADVSTDSDTGSLADCIEYSSVVLVEGNNDVEIVDGPGMFSSECGSAGPEVVGSFTADKDGNYEFTLLPADFLASLYLVRADAGCDPMALAPEGCEGPDTPLGAAMAAGETIYVFADSESGGAAVTIVISAL
ncbi:MAG: hypothetical protein KC457_24900 [Myxococcales bacterium]|nr:hypothetical protein [Myxococcales bacterium]